MESKGVVNWLKAEDEKYLWDEKPLSAVLQTEIFCQDDELKMEIIKDMHDRLSNGVEVFVKDRKIGPILFYVCPIDNSVMVTRAGHYENVKSYYVQAICKQMNDDYKDKAQIYMILLKPIDWFAYSGDNGDDI